MLGIIWGSWIRDIKNKQTNKQTNKQIPADIKHQAVIFLKNEIGVYLGVRTCQTICLFHTFRFPKFYCVDCFVSFVLRCTYVTREVYRLLHRGRMSRNRFQAQKWEKQKELANATMKWKGKGGFLTTIQIVWPAPSLPLRALPIYCHPSSWVANHTPR